MSKGTLFDKVWDLHTVGTMPSGLTQLFIGLHLIHEVTSPQAFAMLKERDLKVLFDSQLQQLQKLYNNNNSSLLQQIEYLKNMDKLINND
jgi:homoaconitase/3-isopropylmalate dehydratase large subunit